MSRAITRTPSNALVTDVLGGPLLDILEQCVDGFHEYMTLRELHRASLAMRRENREDARVLAELLREMVGQAPDEVTVVLVHGVVSCLLREPAL